MGLQLSLKPLVTRVTNNVCAARREAMYCLAMAIHWGPYAGQPTCI